LPPAWREPDWSRNPAIDFMRDRLDLSEPFSEDVVRKANATYLGLCAFVDHQVGRVLAALEASGQGETTRVIYTTDHGESMGARGIVGKFTMFDESAAVPLLLAGPEVPADHVCDTPVSLIDIFPTALQTVGATPEPADADAPGRSLIDIAAKPDAQRTILCQYHALATRHAVYMLRDRAHKYVHYHNDRPQLFAAADTAELHDLAQDPVHASTVRDMETRLCEILDPEATDLAAKADQRNYAEARAGKPAAWPVRTDGPTITYTTIPPHLDPALADAPATRVPGWKPTRDLPDDWGTD
jgi:choline-sulfatase